MARLNKDECCTCLCHEALGYDYAECPLCYFSDGNRNLNNRVSEHLEMLGAHPRAMAHDEIKKRGGE